MRSCRLRLGAAVCSCRSASCNTIGCVHKPAKEGRMVRHYPHPNIPSFAFVQWLTTDLDRRQLSELQKKSYLDAVLCLSKKDAISGIANTVHRYDDHVAVHNSQTPNIHWVVRALLSVMFDSTDRFRVTSSYGTDTSSLPTRRH
jgi:hypothetical protein